MSVEKIKDLIAVNPVKGALPCAVAHFIAAWAKADPVEVGRAATDLGVKLDQCQLGLFGYGRKGKSEYKIVGRKVEVGQEVLDLIRSGAKDGRISCAKLWEIAAATGVMRAEAGNAADSMGIKVTPCQLGAF